MFLEKTQKYDWMIDYSEKELTEKLVEQCLYKVCQFILGSAVNGKRGNTLTVP